MLLLALLLAACGSDGEGAGRDGDAASSSATTTTAPRSTTSSTAAGAGGEVASGDDDTGTAAVVLRGDGLGAVDLGARPDDAIAAVSAALGDPTADTGWASPHGGYGTCPGERIRGVEWEHLVLLFTDGDTAYGTGEHLFTWRLTGAPPALGTAKGLGYQATVADAEELYPGDVEVTEPDEPFPGFVTIRLDGGTITGYLDGDVITNLEAGSGCGE